MIFAAPGVVLLIRKGPSDLVVASSHLAYDVASRGPKQGPELSTQIPKKGRRFSDLDLATILFLIRGSGVRVPPRLPVSPFDSAHLLKHWDRLTLFLQQAGAPLDNNICERALKKAIRHRKNSYSIRPRTALGWATCL